MSLYYEFVLILEAVSVNIFQTARCYISEDSHLNTHRYENLKSLTRHMFAYMGFEVSFKLAQLVS
jgi:hypothetical protein